MVAPMEGTHGENFFFQMGYQVEKCYARGCQKKSTPISALVRPQWNILEKWNFLLLMPNLTDVHHPLNHHFQGFWPNLT